MENNPAAALYNLLVTRDFEPQILNSAGKPVTDPGEAELFSFDWSTDNKNYGTVVVLLGSENELEVYYGDNLGRAMDGEHKKAWYGFLAQLKKFASRNLLTFELNNINRLKYTMQGMAAIREGLHEGYYGRKNISYSDQPKQTRLMIRHSRNLGEGEARYRAIESLFVEAATGERFRVPSRSLTHGRMLARHVAEGGTPYDAFGQHITDMVSEVDTLAKFARASRGRELSEQAQHLAQEAARHYHDLRAKARRMISQRGYREAVDQYDPVQHTAIANTVQDIRSMFLEQNIDARIEQALPILARLQGKSMKEADEFESWAAALTEQSPAMPDDRQSLARLQELLKNPLPVGPDATNATEQLNDIFGDNELFDRLAELAQRDADADARDIVRGRLSELGIQLPEDEPVAAPQPAGMGEDLDADGVMMTRPSNMSSESATQELDMIKKLALG